MRLQYLLIIYAKVSLILSKSCENHDCNGAGTCVENDGQPYCDCLESIYTGVHCEKLTDHCIESPCKNNGKCR